MRRVKRWLAWFVVPIIVCIGIVANRAAGSALLADSDTSVLLAAIRERHAPLSWFWTDWPLKNHFYRPVSTLFFELDEWLHPGSPAGFGLTNALLACACVLLLFWFVRELTDSPWLAGVSSGLFGLWHLTAFSSQQIAGVCWWLAVLALCGIFRGGKRAVGSSLLAFLTLAFASQLLSPTMPFGYRIVGWLPGRTASTMTVFALLSLAAYARFERLTSRSLPGPAAEATDVPATKGTVVEPTASGRWTWGWFLISVLGLALALGCYEQAVMVPAALVAVAVLFRATRRNPTWWVHGAFWAVLLGYFVLRSNIVPSSASGYQLQQFRNGPGVVISLTEYLLPAWNWIFILGLTLSGGILLLLEAAPWILVALTGGNLASWYLVWKHRLRWTVLGFFAMSFLAYLPMAWLQQFGHYHYWPSALRAVYVTGLLSVALKALMTAVSLPKIQAPIRQRPAPGSLPRP